MCKVGATDSLQPWQVSMAKNNGPPKLGQWYLYCCIHDLAPIQTAEDLEGAMEQYEDRDECGGITCWDTLSEALADLEPACWGDAFDMGMIWGLAKICDYNPKAGVLLYPQGHDKYRQPEPQSAEHG